MKGILSFFLILGLMIGLASSLHATTISYDTSDLGGGVWQYSYWVSDYTFNSNYGFTVYFDYGLYENITPVSDSLDWNEISWEPDPTLGPGVYDALALIDSASLADPFIVSFNWLGSGSPWGYTQNFEVYYLDPFQVFETGSTAPVPEPGTILLLGSGIVAGLFGFRKILKQ